jgi:hypothetical protein
MFGECCADVCCTNVGFYIFTPRFLFGWFCHFCDQFCDFVDAVHPEICGILL